MEITIRYDLMEMVIYNFLKDQMKGSELIVREKLVLILLVLTILHLFVI